MKKEDLLSDDFLKQFKTGDELHSFLAQLQKRGIEKMLEGELDAHLGYDKHDKSHSIREENLQFLFIMGADKKQKVCLKHIYCMFVMPVSHEGRLQAVEGYPS